MSPVEAAVRSEAAEDVYEASDNGRVVLSEWSTTRWRLDDDTARRLGETPWVSVAIDRLPGWWKVSTRQWVGAFTLGDLRIIVRPKIKPENLFLLLEVGLRPEAWQAEAIDYATNDELLPALVSFFARTAETTLARGLFHHYRHEEDDRLALRGRIDFVRQFRRGGVLVPMACSWDDFSADVDENRCLTAAIRLALRVPDVPHDDRRRMRRLLAALDGVAEPTASAALERLDRIRYTRLNEHYRPALRLARLILANLTLQDQHGDTAASAFMVDMNQLFESFVTVRLQRKLRGQLQVVPQTKPYLDIDKQVQIRPDLVLRRACKTVGVADIKYKLAAEPPAPDPDPDRAGSTGHAAAAVTRGRRRARLGSESTVGGPRGRHGDYYQLLAYTTALAVTGGTLIYCADTAERAPDETRAGKPRRHRPSRPSLEPGDGLRRASSRLAASTITVAHANVQLHAVAVDLSGSPDEVDDQMAALASHLCEAAQQPGSPTTAVTPAAASGTRRSILVSSTLVNSTLVNSTLVRQSRCPASALRRSGACRS